MIPEFSDKEKPLTAGVGRVEEAQPTFFYKRRDGSIIMVHEAEAWGLHKGRNQVVGYATIPFEQIGVSDGVIYQQAVIEAREIFKQAGLSEAQARIRKGLAEEIEAARGHFQVPRNFDFTDNNRLPIDVKTGDLIEPNKRYESRTNQ